MVCVASVSVPPLGILFVRLCRALTLSAGLSFSLLLSSSSVHVACAAGSLFLHVPTYPRMAPVRPPVLAGRPSVGPSLQGTLWGCGTCRSYQAYVLTEDPIMSCITAAEGHWGPMMSCRTTDSGRWVPMMSCRTPNECLWGSTMNCTSTD